MENQIVDADFDVDEVDHVLGERGEARPANRARADAAAFVVPAAPLMPAAALSFSLALDDAGPLTNASRGALHDEAVFTVYLNPMLLEF